MCNANPILPAYTHKLILPDSDACQSLLARDGQALMIEQARQDVDIWEKQNPHFRLLGAFKRAAQSGNADTRAMYFSFIEEIRSALDIMCNIKTTRVHFEAKDTTWACDDYQKNISAVIYLPKKPDDHDLDNLDFMLHYRGAGQKLTFRVEKILSAGMVPAGIGCP